MKIKKIKFVENEDGAIPNKITVEMSLADAVVIAEIFGRLSDDVFTARGLPMTDIYGVLAGDVLNRYFEDGVDDALKFINKALSAA